MDDLTPTESPAAFPPPLDAIRHWKQRELSSTMLMRSLVHYDKWELPITDRSVHAMLASNAPPEPWLYKDGQGRYHLFLFSDVEAYRQYRQSAGNKAVNQHFVTRDGVWVFGLDLSPLEAIHINPLSPDALTLGPELFDRVNTVASAVEVERALASLRGASARLTGQLQIVRNFPAYHVGLRLTNEGYRFIQAPDTRRRVMAAVFTLNDGYETYMRDFGLQHGDDVVHTLMNGEQLFRHLIESGLDGIVFNCAGPMTPVTFAPAFARLVLDAR